MVLGWHRAFAAVLNPGASAAPDEVRARQALAMLFSDIDAARALGYAYIRTGPSGADKAALLAELGAMFASSSRRKLRRTVNARRERDFRRQDLAIVDGWVLSATEARLCALAALL